MSEIFETGGFIAAIVILGLSIAVSILMKDTTTLLIGSGIAVLIILGVVVFLLIDIRNNLRVLNQKIEEEE